MQTLIKYHVIECRGLKALKESIIRAFVLELFSSQHTRYFIDQMNVISVGRFMCSDITCCLVLSLLLRLSFEASFPPSISETQPLPFYTQHVEENFSHSVYYSLVVFFLVIGP